MFVEDDTAVGNLIATTLETQNYQFHRAKNGQQAVLDALSYRPDVMLLDLGLPDIDGIEIIKKFLVRYDSQKTSEASARYQNGGLVIDYAAGCAWRDGQELHLTPIEYKLLCLLAKNTGKVLTHNYIIGEIWGSTSDSIAAELPSLRVFMATLRKKLETDQSHPQYIQTHIGIGYRMIQCGKDREAPENP